jgi:hypothetical protein
MVSMLQNHENGIFRFGAYEADPGSGKLRKSGVRLRVQSNLSKCCLCCWGVRAQWSRGRSCARNCGRLIRLSTLIIALTLWSISCAKH